MRSPEEHIASLAALVGELRMSGGPDGQVRGEKEATELDLPLE